MRFSPKNTHKIIAGILIGAVLAPSLAFIQPQQAQAQGLETVVEVGANLVVNTLSKVFGDAEKFKEYVLDPIAWQIANALIEKMAADIIDWVNNGFQGDPAFVTDLEGYLLETADEEIGRFIEGSELGFLCDPLSTKIALEFSIYEPFRDRVTCTLTDVVDNMNAFIGGDFSQGGWDGWFELTTNRQNNPYGAYLIASDELARRVYGAQQRKTKILEFGDGFLSFEHCVERPALPSDHGAQPGQTVPDCKITTPGKVIEDQVNGAIGSGKERLYMADEINEIISAVIGQLIQQTLQGGLSALSGGSGSGGGSSFTSRLRGSRSSLVDDGRVGESLQDSLSRRLSNERKYRTAKQASLTSIGETESLLNQLKTCYACREGTVSGPQCPSTVTTGGRNAQSGSPENVQATIDSLKSLKDRLSEEIAESQGITAELSDLQARVDEAETDDELAEIANEHQEIASHGDFAVFDAEDERDQIQNEMNTLQNETKQKLDECDGGNRTDDPTLRGGR